MRLILIAALALSGCASANQTQLLDTLKAVASDPNCAHVDRIQGTLGGFTGNNLAVFLERTCPATP